MSFSKQSDGDSEKFLEVPTRLRANSSSAEGQEKLETKTKRGREWVKMNGIAIKRPDVEVSNGVVHVLDGVDTPQ